MGLLDKLTEKKKISYKRGDIIHGALLGLNTHACANCGYFTLVPALCYYHEGRDEGVVQHVAPDFCTNCQQMYLQLYLPKSYVELYFILHKETKIIEEDVEIDRTWRREKRIAVLMPANRNWWRALDSALAALKDEKKALEQLQLEQNQQALVELFKNLPPLIAIDEEKKELLFPHMPRKSKTAIDLLTNVKEELYCSGCGGTASSSCPECKKENWEAEIVTRLISINDLFGKRFETKEEAMKNIAENEDLINWIKKKTNISSGKMK